jgi:uncharacterized protein YcnI
MINQKIMPLILAFCLTFATQTALAHVTLENPTATAGDSYKAVLRVGHACTRSASTVALSVIIPEGVTNAKPMPKAGWTVSITQRKLSELETLLGRAINETVQEITWKANTLEASILDSHYDEFVLRVRLPDAAGALWWKSTQSCTEGKIAWFEVPAEGTATKGLKSPAALLELMPRKPVTALPTVPTLPPVHTHHH